MKYVIPGLVAGTLLALVVGIFMLGSDPTLECDRAGMKLFAQKHYTEAVQVWNEGLEKHPGSCKLHYRIGTALAVMKEYGGASAEFAKALAIEPRHAPTHFEMGMMYLHQDRLTEAEVSFKETLACAEWYPEAHYWLGRLRDKQGRKEEARQLYIDELNVNPGCTLAWGMVFGDVPKERAAEQVSAGQ